MPWSKPPETGPPADPDPPSLTDLLLVLERHVREGLSPDLALDLVLNEVAVRATNATHSSAAALALIRDGEMVCRASTGDTSPDLGIPLNTRKGLSGACLRTRKSQRCVDTQSDPRIDSAACLRLGIRSMLTVPVFEKDVVVGVVEVFSRQTEAFFDSDQRLLETIARETAALRRLALELRDHPPAPMPVPRAVPAGMKPGLEVLPPSGERTSPVTMGSATRHAAPTAKRAFDVWALVLGSLVFAATAALTLMIGWRTGVFSSASSKLASEQSKSAAELEPAAGGIPAVATDHQRVGKGSLPASRSGAKAKSSSPADSSTPSTAGEMVVYEKGKVVFRMKPAQPSRIQPSVASAVASTLAENPDSSSNSTSGMNAVWLAPGQAERRLLERVEPQYPPEARAAHRAGDVVLEIQVAEDGSVASVRTLTGDPLLAAAATAAVRNWRYQPYTRNGQPLRFQTEVTLRFALPD